MSFQVHGNFVHGNVLTPPSPAISGTSLTLQQGQGTIFPAAPYNVVLAPPAPYATPTNAEIATVSGITGDVLTIVRGAEGSTAQSVTAGYTVTLTPTAKTFTDIESGFNLGSNALSASAITLGYAQNITAPTFNSGTPTAVSGLTINPTLPGTRNVKVTLYTGQVYNSAATTTTISIYSGATSAALTTLLQSMTINTGGLNVDTTIPAIVIYVAQAPSAGSIWYTAAVSVGAGTATFYTSAASPGFILAEAI